MDTDAAGKTSIVGMEELKHPSSSVPCAEEHVEKREDHGEDNGEDLSEESTPSEGVRRESQSSADGNDELETQQNNDEDITNKQQNTDTPQQNTTRRKRRKPRRKSRSKSHSRSGSRQQPTNETTTTDTQTLNTNNTNDENLTNPTTTNTNPANINNILIDPPPTRGRSNAFYGVKPTPPLHHANSDGASHIRQQQQAGDASSVPLRRNTTVGFSPVALIPEPAHSGISRPKLFNYWKGFSAPGFEKSVLSHSRRFLVGFAETIGRRPSMEDCMVVNGAYRGRGQEDYFALFDGHGGRDAAAFAAEHLHEVLAEKLKTNNAVKSLKEAFAETHKMISDQKIVGGTTAVVALFIGKKGFIANVGDTRAVLCRDGVPLRVSLDHKPELPTETLRIRKLGGTVTTTYNSAGQATSRVNGMLAVSRALGDTPLHPYVSSDPEIHGPLNLDPQARNQFVVLACDGVWDVLSDEEATSIVAPIANPEEASRRLRDEAFARGSTDNISVMVIRCPPFPAE